jgi:uncharacterized protein YkwD
MNVIGAFRVFCRFPSFLGISLVFSLFALPVRAGNRPSSPFPCSSIPSAAHAVKRNMGNMEQSILYYVNLHRRAIRLASLQLNNSESAIAAQHSRDMATGRTPFGHTGFHERISMLNKQVGPIRVAAENVAYGQMSAKEVVDGWLGSPGHRRNIEGNFRLTGIGLARDRNGRIYYTQIFTR